MARPSPDPGAASSARTPLQHRLAQRRIESRPIVVDGDDDALVVNHRSDRDARARPLRRVVEEVAEHLVEVFALHADRMRRRHARVDRDSARRVQPLQRAAQSIDRFRDDASRAERRGRSRGARMRQVKIDLPLHPLDLLANHRIVALVRDHRERHLESVREIGPPSPARAVRSLRDGRVARSTHSPSAAPHSDTFLRRVAARPSERARAAGAMPSRATARFAPEAVRR